MKRLRLAVLIAVVVVAGMAQRQPPNRPVRLPSRGTRGAVAGGSEYATGAGMRMYYSGGNAVDAGIATMLAASVTEFSHFGLGGEAPILVRTKAGKVYAIAGCRHGAEKWPPRTSIAITPSSPMRCWKPRIARV